MMHSTSDSPQPGERWLVNFQPVDSPSQALGEATVKLIDFDPRTQTWTVEREGVQGTAAVLARDLIKKLDRDPGKP